MKRNLIIVLIFILAAAAGFIYFTKDEISFSKETSMYKAVPVSVPVFIEFNALKSIPFKETVLNEFIKAELNVLFIKQAAGIDSLIRNNNELQGGLRSESFILAFDFVGENNVFPLLIMKTENSGKQKALNKLLSVIYPKENFNYEQRDYSSYKIISVTNVSNGNTAFFSFSKGLFLASSKSLLLEQCLRQLELESISDNTYFSEVNKTVTAQSKISLYVNHHTFPEMANLWIYPNSSKSNNEFGETLHKSLKSEIKNFGKFAAWSELDIKIDESDIQFNGVSAADDSLNQYLSVFSGQEPVRFEADEILPKNTSFYTSFSFSDKSLFFENLENYFTHSDNYYKREDRIKKMEAGFRSNFKNAFQGMVKDEIIVAYTNVPSETSKEITLFILQTEGKSNTEPQFLDLLNAYAGRKNINIENLKSVYKVDSETRFDIYNFPYPSFPAVWLGNPFGFAEARYAAFYDNYLVFCSTEKGLKDYLYNMVLESTLVKDLRYAEFKEKMVNRSNINAYINIDRIFDLNKEIFNNDVSKLFYDKEEFFRRIYALNWQLVCEKEIFFNSLHLSLNKEGRQEARTTWQSSIGETIRIKPQLVINHNEKGNMDVILQDEKNNLHQVTKDGRLRWSISLNEPVLSKIHQVDIFRNGKLQYLFNTKSKLFLIDRDGNNVANFPLNFRSPATNGVNVFDYDNNRKYRFFVACENKKICAYDNDGKMVTGWKFEKTDYVVKNPVQHFRVHNKDYIVFKDKSHIYIQNRIGENRITTSAKFENSENPLILNLSGRPKIVATDVTGKVYYLFFDGSFAEKKTDKFTPDHFFNMDDINGNGVPDFVFADGKELKVFDENGEKLFEKKFKNNITSRPNIYHFSSTVKKVGVVESDANRIHLLDPSGKNHEGFPLQGNSDFSIGKISDRSGYLNLIVGSKGGDLYNYTLN